MEDKVFSVVVLCYRHFEHLDNAISSVLSQDYKRIELIISDDGSDNFPTEKIHKFIEKNKNAQYLLCHGKTGAKECGNG